MGHSLVQLGDFVLSFGGCSFGKVCFNELLIQKPKIISANNLYDCKNNGKIVQMGMQGMTISYCQCTDLPAYGANSYWTGPQCEYTTSLIEREAQPVA